MDSIGVHESKSDPYSFAYKYQQPFRLQTGVAVNVLKNWILSSDVEMLNYQQLSYSPETGDSLSGDYFSRINQSMATTFTRAWNVRFGSELRFGANFQYYSRLGFSWLQSPFRNSVSVGGGSQDENRYSMGLGWRSSFFTLDLSYVLSRTDVYRIPYTVNGLQPEGIYSTLNRHFVTLSASLRF
jgi:hypothetical protein